MVLSLGTSLHYRRLETTGTPKVLVSLTPPRVGLSYITKRFAPPDISVLVARLHVEKTLRKLASPSSTIGPLAI